jgi:hypothetical protein
MTLTAIEVGAAVDAMFPHSAEYAHRTHNVAAHSREDIKHDQDWSVRRDVHGSRVASIEA